MALRGLAGLAPVLDFSDAEEATKEVPSNAGGRQSDDEGPLELELDANFFAGAQGRKSEAVNLGDESDSDDEDEERAENVAWDFENVAAFKEDLGVGDSLMDKIQRRLAEKRELAAEAAAEEAVGEEAPPAKKRRKKEKKEEEGSGEVGKTEGGNKGKTEEDPDEESAGVAKKSMSRPKTASHLAQTQVEFADLDISRPFLKVSSSPLFEDCAHYIMHGYNDPTES